MSESAGVATKTFLSILVIANVVGNTLVCVIIMRNRDMRYCISNLNVKIGNRVSLLESRFCTSVKAISN